MMVPGGLLLATLLASTASAGEPVGVVNRFSAGVWFDAAPSSRAYGLDMLLSDTLRASLVEKPKLHLDLLAAARLNVRLFDGGRVDQARVRALELRFKLDKVVLDVGRFTPKGGGIRLVDGVQALGDLGHGVQLGAWAGLSPDPWNTMPALRFGGGPVLAWTDKRGEVSLLGEVLATPDGLDRVSGVARGRVELGRIAEMSGLIDLQAGGKDAPVRLSDATAFFRLDPHKDVRVDLMYDAWSSLSYLVSSSRDPTLTRFAARSVALAEDPWNPQDSVDTTVYHMAGATVAWDHALTEDGPTHLRLTVDGRYRHHTLADRRYARAGLRADVTGLVDGRVDVGVGERFLWWQGHPGSDSTASVWAQLDKGGMAALDVSAQVVVQPLEGAANWAPAVYADAFVDVMATPDLTVSAGYAFGNALDLDRWDTSHSALLQLTWRADSRALARRRQEEP
jgi:hypothetical protein